MTTEMATVTDTISRTRSRIVQSPERIKRNITSMGNTAAEDKRTVATNEAKTRDLQTKIAALLNIEKVRPTLQLLLKSYSRASLAGCTIMRGAAADH